MNDFARRDQCIAAHTYSMTEWRGFVDSFCDRPRLKPRRIDSALRAFQRRASENAKKVLAIFIDELMRLDEMNAACVAIAKRVEGKTQEDAWQALAGMQTAHVGLMRLAAALYSFEDREPFATEDYVLGRVWLAGADVLEVNTDLGAMRVHLLRQTMRAVAR